MTETPVISITDQVKATRNEGYGTFVLTNPDTGESREFEMKHLSYDRYIEFCQLAYPIIASISSGLTLGNSKGEMSFDFDPSSLDYKALLAMAGSELPRMVKLCCQMSDPKITVDDVKRLGHRPQQLLNVVLEQVKHNRMVQEFADFFPSLVERITALVPEAQLAVTPVPVPMAEEAMTTT